MSSSLKPFFVKLSLFSILTLGVLLLWQQFASTRFQTDLLWFTWLFFIVSTALIHIILVKAAERNPKDFIMYFMAITGLKFVAYLIIIIIYGFLKRETVLGFSLCFLIMYFFYSVFEVATLIKHFKK